MRKPILTRRLAALGLAAIATAGYAAYQRTFGVPAEYRKESAQFRATHPQDAKDAYLSIKQLDRIGARELRSRGSFPKLVRGNPDQKIVALTFDDGPYPQTTPRLLAILKAAKVKATMFNIGYKVEKDPELLHAEIAGGHEIANHTYNHKRLPTLDAEGIDEELRFGAAALQKIGKIPGEVDVCRPPGGQYNDDVIASATAHKYTIALWTDDPGDYTEPGAKVIESRLIRDLNPGGIVLLHDGVEQTLQALPGFIAEAKRRGYTFVTCSEMMKDPKCIKKGGPNTYAPRLKP